MIKSDIITNSDIDYILNLPEVIKAKKLIDSKENGFVNLSINLTPSIKETLCKNLELDLSKTIMTPMRWIKGDTLSHIDKSLDKFNKTYLAYLTNSPGELIIDSKSYPISKGNAYVFSEGLSHETIGTGSEPRLLLGPMNESGIQVGGFGITADGATDTIYIRSSTTNTYEYRINNGTWSNGFLPVAISNSNPNPANNILKIIFTTDITLSNSFDYFLCSSDGIQFGSTSLNINGTRPTINIDGVSDYPGLINNNFNSGNGYNNIYVFNLKVIAINGATLANDGNGPAWIGQSYFGKGASNNYIVNCSSTGPIINDGGGIVGGYCGSQSGATLYIIGCSSSGDLGTYSGGIVGFNAGENGGQVTCEKCWSTGSIGTNAGGIYGEYAGTNGGVVSAINCYSQGAIDEYGGGIYGQFAGNGTSSQAQAINCYSQGIIGNNAGGIYGQFAGNGGATPATNCYSSGTIATSGNGIYGSNAQDDNPVNCYAANGNWNNTTANSFLTGVPNPVIGGTWVYTGTNQPYELVNMGYTPYSITNITSQQPSLINTYSLSINSSETTTSAIISGQSYTILQKSGGDSSSYGSISINSNTGVISTTSETNSGNYILYIRNTGSYNITTFNLSVFKNEVPNVAICFPAGTLVLTDQGEIPIDKIDTKVNTIKGKKIIAITESVPLDNYLICIEKNSLGPNIPNRKIITTKDHKIMCDNKLVRAEYLIQYIPSIYKIHYNKEKLYNVLLNDHSLMSISNLIVETMNPNHILAKIYLGNYTREQKNYLIKLLNKYNIQKRKQLFIRNNIFRA
jgi:hypothetical protein